MLIPNCPFPHKCDKFYLNENSMTLIMFLKNLLKRFLLLIILMLLIIIVLIPNVAAALTFIIFFSF